MRHRAGAINFAGTGASGSGQRSYDGEKDSCPPCHGYVVSLSHNAPRSKEVLLAKGKFKVAAQIRKLFLKSRGYAAFQIIAS